MDGVNKSSLLTADTTNLNYSISNNSLSSSHTCSSSTTGQKSTSFGTTTGLITPSSGSYITLADNAISSIYSSIDDMITYRGYNYNWTKLIEKMSVEKLITVAEMMEAMLIAKEDYEYYKNFIVFVVSNNVCPEDFILQNIEYLTPEIILKKHQDLISSGTYKNLKIYIMAHN